MQKIILLLVLQLLVSVVVAQEIPTIYSNLGKDEKGLYIKLENGKVYAQKANDQFQFKDLYGNPKGTKQGVFFDFKYPRLNGTLYYGFINYGDGKIPQPVFFKKTSKILGGKALINIVANLSGRYDMIGWEKKGKGVLGFRIVNDKGEMLYDGKVAFSYNNGKFKAEPTIVEGPFINKLKSNSVTISYATNKPLVSSVKIGEKLFQDKKKTQNHEIEINDLNPVTKYDYTISVGGLDFSYQFETAPKPGTRKKFMFAYASDSRSGKGGGERNIFGTNAYIMKKITALAKYEGAKFMQFTGDLINGYENSKQRIELQYANWKHAVEPFWHHMPIVVGFGNHEAYTHYFITKNGATFEIDQFPFKDNSSESIFQQNFVNVENGPQSEDGSKYDPNPKKQDFPSYKETVFWYTYDNVAIVVLNSDYWYTPAGVDKVGGNIHAFIMDNQLKWLEETIGQLETNENIDHIFFTLHTPFFPNGGHVRDDMWYAGSNKPRPYVAGKPYEEGIIQRRDQLLDILVNKSNKVVAALTGDEHNYNLLTITDEMERYPKEYQHKKLKLSRKFYQINNGAAGAPYYAQEITPWMNNLRNFSTQNALVLIEVDGPKVYVKVKNPDTLELIDEYSLR